MNMRFLAYRTIILCLLLTSIEASADVVNALNNVGFHNITLVDV